MAVESTKQPEKTAVHEIAGGWITEKAGTEVPAFLRLVYVVVAAICAAYLIVYMYGEVNHSERGPLVKQFNLSTVTSEPLMYIVAAMVVLFFVAVSLFAAQKSHD